MKKITVIFLMLGLIIFLAGSGWAFTEGTNNSFFGNQAGHDLLEKIKRRNICPKTNDTML